MSGTDNIIPCFRALVKAKPAQRAERGRTSVRRAASAVAQAEIPPREENSTERAQNENSARAQNPAAGANPAARVKFRCTDAMGTTAISRRNDRCAGENPTVQMQKIPRGGKIPPRGRRILPQAESPPNGRKNPAWAKIPLYDARERLFQHHHDQESHIGANPAVRAQNSCTSTKKSRADEKSCRGRKKSRRAGGGTNGAIAGDQPLTAPAVRPDTSVF